MTELNSRDCSQTFRSWKHITECCAAHIVHLIAGRFTLKNYEVYGQHNIVQACYKQYCRKLRVFTCVELELFG